MKRLIVLIGLAFLAMPLFCETVKSDDLTSKYGISNDERQKSSYIEKNGYSFRYIGNGTWDVNPLSKTAKSTKTIKGISGFLVNAIKDWVFGKDSSLVNAVLFVFFGVIVGTIPVLILNFIPPVRGLVEVFLIWLLLIYALFAAAQAFETIDPHAGDEWAKANPVAAAQVERIAEWLSKADPKVLAVQVMVFFAIVAIIVAVIFNFILHIRLTDIALTLILALFVFEAISLVFEQGLKNIFHPDVYALVVSSTLLALGIPAIGNAFIGVAYAMSIENEHDYAEKKACFLRILGIIDIILVVIPMILSGGLLILGAVLGLLVLLSFACGGPQTFIVLIFPI
jgi:hypothetical protein